MQKKLAAKERAEKIRKDHISPNQATTAPDARTIEIAINTDLAMVIEKGTQSSLALEPAAKAKLQRNLEI